MFYSTEALRFPPSFRWSFSVLFLLSGNMSPKGAARPRLPGTWIEGPSPPGPAMLTQSLPTAPLPPAPHLQEAEVPIVRTRACERMYHKGPVAHGQGTVIKADMLCAGRKGQGYCQVRPRPCPLPSVSAVGAALLWGRPLTVSSPYRAMLGAPWSVTGWTPGSRWAC